MFDVLFKTEEFAEEFAQIELKRFKINAQRVSRGFYKASFKSEVDLCIVLSEIGFYSRLFERVYIKVCCFEDFEDFESVCDVSLEFIKSELSFEVDSSGFSNYEEIERKIRGLVAARNPNLRISDSKADFVLKVFEVDSVKYIGIDAFGFDLSAREIIHSSDYSLNTIFMNYCFYLLGFDRVRGEFKILNVNADVGDFAIEAASYKSALHVRRRCDFSFTRVFDFDVSLPKRDSRVFCQSTAIVLENVDFKRIKENSRFASVKVKISSFDFDWYDVKFKKGDFDFTLCQLPYFEEKDERKEYLSQLFYQAEFVSKRGVLVISSERVDVRLASKNKLKVEREVEVVLGKMKYFVYVFR